jgi:WD40 repeat protein
MSENSKNLKLVLFIFTGFLLLLLFFYVQGQRNSNQNRYDDIQELNVVTESLEAYQVDRSKAARLIEWAYQLGNGTPLTRTYQTLSKIGNSFRDNPHYVLDCQRGKEITYASFLPGGKKIIFALSDGTAEVVDSNGKCEVFLKHELKKRINAVGFSMKYDFYVTVSDDEKVKVWFKKKENPIIFKHNNDVNFVDVSSDGQLIATASSDGTVKLLTVCFDKKGNAQIKEDFIDNNLPVLKVLISKDGSKILTRARENFARLWDLKTKKYVQLKHDKTVESISFSKNGTLILTGSRDGVAKTWDMKGNELKSFDHGIPITYAMISSENKHIMTVSKNGQVKIWDINKNREKSSWNYNNTISAIGFFSDGSLAVTASVDHTVRIHDLQGELKYIINGFTGKINSWGDIPTHDSRFITTDEEGRIKVWELQSDIVTDLKLDTQNIANAVVSNDLSKIVTFSDGKYATLWEYKKGHMKELTKLQHKASLVYSAFRHDGLRILTISEDFELMIWHDDGTLHKKIPKRNQYLRKCAAFSHKDDKILIGTKSIVEVYNTEGQFQFEITGFSGFVKSVSFSPEDDLILVGLENGKVSLYHSNGNLLKKLVIKKDEKIHDRAVSVVGFSPDSKLFLTASYDNTVNLFNISGKLKATLKGHSGSIVSASFLAENNFIITSAIDHTARLWNSRGNLLATLDGHMGEVLAAKVDNKNKKIITISKDGVVYIWKTPKEIYNWIQKSKIPYLTTEDIDRIGIESRPKYERSY